METKILEIKQDNSKAIYLLLTGLLAYTFFFILVSPNINLYLKISGAIFIFLILFYYYKTKKNYIIYCFFAISFFYLILATSNIILSFLPIIFCIIHTLLQKKSFIVINENDIKIKSGLRQIVIPNIDIDYYIEKDEIISISTKQNKLYQYYLAHKLLG